jgi:hypothetical protein
LPVREGDEVLQHLRAAGLDWEAVDQQRGLAARGARAQWRERQSAGRVLGGGGGG